MNKVKAGFVKFLQKNAELWDVLFIPFTYLSARLLKFLRVTNEKSIFGFSRMRHTKKILFDVGVFPVVDMYHDPLFNPKYIAKSLREDRFLPGIDLNTQEQLKLLEEFNYSSELLEIPREKEGENSYYYNNVSFGSGDGEYFYNIIRHFKPRRIVEVGAGNSTLLALRALEKNRREDENYRCEHICIEPYENPWLENLGPRIIREKVEEVDREFFKNLGEKDILFIDSSHIIRPQGDVLAEYLQILPLLNPGVLIHIHDIFTPKDYCDEWIRDNSIFWNEQYLLEAFLSCNEKFEIIGALNYLQHNYNEKLTKKCPVLKETKRETASFWIRKK